jgi:hypothetical protein
MKELARAIQSLIDNGVDANVNHKVEINIPTLTVVKFAAAVTAAAAFTHFIKKL